MLSVACSVALGVLIGGGCGGGGASDGAPAAGPDRPAGPDMAPLAGGVQEGELALTLGEPVRAIRILQAVPEGDGSYPYAQELLSVAKQDLEDVVNAWLEDIDTLVAVGQIRTARSRTNYLLAHFPLEGVNELLVVKRQQQIESKTKEAQGELRETEKQARDLLLANELESAIETLKDGRALAWEVDSDRALKWEQMIAATEAHFRTAIEEGSMSRAASEAKARRVFRRRKSGGSAASAPEAVAPPPPDPRQHQALELVHKGKDAKAKKDYFEAIKSYEAALKLWPSSNEANSALKSLAPARKKLVNDFLAKANQHFLRQDLKAAFPYFKKVLVLEPDQKRALEGIRMYENRERIRGGKTKKR